MRPRSILETILYANDLEQARWFYATVRGLETDEELSDLGLLFRASPDQVLLIFDPRESDQPGRSVPAHGARGPGHIAFRIDPETYDDWLRQLSAHGVGVEHEHQWDGERPGRSIYIRDPSGNSVELIDADIWPK